jgi:hypothetical protein
MAEGLHWFVYITVATSYEVRQVRPNFPGLLVGPHPRIQAPNGRFGDQRLKGIRSEIRNLPGGGYRASEEFDRVRAEVKRLR